MMTEQNPPISADQLNRLKEQLTGIIEDAHNRSSRCESWRHFWESIDVILGLSAAILAAIAGAAGLASTAGRIPAAILALTAAAITAAGRFLRSNERYDLNRRRRNEWMALERSARFIEATEGYPNVQSLYDSVYKLLERQALVMELGGYAPISRNLINE